MTVSASRKLADRIRDFVFATYVQPALDAGDTKVTVRAGDVHDSMLLSGRMPAVCGAVGSDKFLTQHNLQLLDRKGPTQGANVFFIFGAKNSASGRSEERA